MSKPNDLLSNRYTFLRFLKTKSEEVIDGYKRTIKCVSTILPIKTHNEVIENEITDWPGRIMFPEQILGVHPDQSLWYVCVLGKHVEVTEFDNAYISKCQAPKNRIEYQIPINESEELMSIDERTDSPFDYYLQAHSHSELLWMVGIGAFTLNRFYCTFHDREMAMLYAESLDDALRNRFQETIIKTNILDDDK